MPVWYVTQHTMKAFSTWYVTQTHDGTAHRQNCQKRKTALDQRSLQDKCKWQQTNSKQTNTQTHTHTRETQHNAHTYAHTRTHLPFVPLHATICFELANTFSGRRSCEMTRSMKSLPLMVLRARERRECTSSTA